METFTVEVEHTLANRVRDEAGRFRSFTVRVEVMAEDGDEAALIGAQLVGATRDHMDGMVLTSRVVI